MGALPLGADLREVELVGAGAGDDHEVDALGHEIGPRSEGLAAQPLHAAALDGVPDLLRHHDAEPRGQARSVGLAPRDEEDEVARRSALAHGLNAQELRAPTNAAIGTMLETRRRLCGGGHSHDRDRRPVYFL